MGHSSRSTKPPAELHRGIYIFHTSNTHQLVQLCKQSSTFIKNIWREKSGLFWTSMQMQPSLFCFWKREDTHAHTQKLVPCNVWSTSCLEDESRICISKLTNVTAPIIHIPLWNGSYIASTDGVISPRMDDIIFFEPSVTENDSRDTIGKWALHSTSCESDKVMFKNLFHDFSWQIPTAVLFQQCHF